MADALLHLAEDLDEAVLLIDYFEHEASAAASGISYCQWLDAQLKQAGKRLLLMLRPVVKGDPTSFNWAYDAMRRTVQDHERGRPIAQRHYLVGPGTPTMAASTLIVARLDACAGVLWQTDIRSPQGCRRLELPFDLKLEDAPDPASHAASRAPGEPSKAGHAPGAPIVLSPSTQRAWRLAETAAKSQWPVLILGSTGTGKEELARHLHRCSGADKNFIPVNCGAIPAELIESELFGHKKGAFTGAVSDQPGVFEAAGHGIVFLDEVGELPLKAQTRFLRVLQEKKVTRLGERVERVLNCRIVAATHRHLWQAVESGSFRADLYYRLAGLIIPLDDLARRPEDLRAMIDAFWQQTTHENPGLPGRALDESAHQRLLAHAWPGNVRELKATLVRAAFLARGPQVSASDINIALGQDAPTPASPPPPSTLRTALPHASADLDFRAHTKRCQRELARLALDQAGGNKSQAARMLGISVQHLGRVLKG
ncbi:sigma 54-interacting transcriptional regulator [Thermomonas flagellata]|uniref:sigma 54-interacting transcriptional regulator n=1 Tax=Thermomonas flagellata TaxID=2888524 RepID=UPI001F04A6E4